MEELKERVVPRKSFGGGKEEKGKKVVGLRWHAPEK